MSFFFSSLVFFPLNLEREGEREKKLLTGNVGVPPSRSMLVP